MSADKSLSKENLQDYPQATGSGRKIMNENLRWFLYGAVPVVGIGILLMCIGIWVLPIPDVIDSFLPPTGTTAAPATTVNVPVINQIVTTAVISPIVTTVTPTTPVPPTTAISPIVTTVVPTTAISPEILQIATTITPTSPVDAAAVARAKEVSPRFSKNFSIQLNPDVAKGLDAARIGGPAGQLAGMISPVTDENQKYIDSKNIVRQVMGIFSLDDSRLTLESLFVLNKGTFQFSLVPVGTYMMACHPERPNDCLAISLQGQEFQINPETVSQTPLDPPVLIPSVDYEEGSIKKCYKVLRRKICVRVFR